MTFQQLQKGFTLVEIMIVVTIISILVAVAIPAYYSYTIKSQTNSCMIESKDYSNQVFILINDYDINSIPVTPNVSACRSITDATGWTISTQQKIIAIAKFPSNARIECDLPNGSSCRVIP